MALFKNRKTSHIDSQSTGVDDDEAQKVSGKLGDILEHLNILKNGMTVKTGKFETLTSLYTGQKLYVDTRDTSVAPHLMFEGTWEPEFTRVWRSTIRPDDVILDIGANFGYYGIVAATELDLAKGAQVHFIEPNPYLVPLIRKSASINGLNRNSHTEQTAIGSENGKTILNLLKNDWGGSSLHGLEQIREYSDIEYEIEEKIETPVITIDQYCQNMNISKVGLIKLDIEGFEDKAFEGMAQTIANSPDLRVLMEFIFKAYEDPRGFFAKLQKSFPALQVIARESGDLINVNSYQDLESASHGRYAMLLLRKQKN